jgi:ubiquinone/menaquinone biosynthesis C-methylase UbiE
VKGLRALASGKPGRSSPGADAYGLGRTTQESGRLKDQAVFFDLPLRRLFEDAGIRPGMRVLDIGSGAGDVAMTAADVVGPTGTVIGMDMNAEILETARERAQVAGLTNVTFVVGDVRKEAPPSGGFDAIVGRAVLRYLADPADVVRHLANYLRPDGRAAFVEPNTRLGLMTYPTCPLAEQVAEWLRAAFERTGTDLEMGFKLYQTLLDAGLAEPRIRAWSNFSAAPDFTGSDLLAATVRSLLPSILEHGIARPDEVAIDTLAERLRAELSERRAIWMGTLAVDAWARKA